MAENPHEALGRRLAEQAATLQSMLDQEDKYRADLLKEAAESQDRSRRMARAITLLRGEQREVQQAAKNKPKALCISPEAKGAILDALGQLEAPSTVREIAEFSGRSEDRVRYTMEWAVREGIVRRAGVRNPARGIPPRLYALMPEYIKK